MRQRTRPVLRALGAGAVVAAVGLGTAGCGTIDKAQSAAIVNGTPIYTSELEQVTDQFNAAFGSVQSNGQQLTEPQTLSYLIEAKFVAPYIANTGVYRPDSQYAALVARVPDASQDTKDFILTVYALANSHLPESAITAIDAEVAKAKIEVAPRYGTFDQSTKLLSTAATPNWIKPGQPTPTSAAAQ